MSKVANSTTAGIVKGIDHVKDVACDVAHNVSDAATYVREKAEDTIPSKREIAKGVEHVKEVASTVAHNVSDAASYVRQKADNAATTVGGALENTGHYLRDDGIHNIATDLTNLVRRNPIPAMLVGLTVGYLLAQTTHRRNGGIHG